MDVRLAKLLAEIAKWGIVLASIWIYVERRFSALEDRALLLEERASNNARRVDLLDVWRDSRSRVSPDGGFSDEAFRGLLRTTIQLESQRLQLLDREDLKRFAQKNDLKQPTE